jgi:uncharacterized protein (DUF427 family)
MNRPDTDHPISIEPYPNRVTITVAGRKIAESDNALALTEAGRDPVLYIPAEDVDFSLLRETDHSSHCRYKGTATYYSVPAPEGEVSNAVWQYREPYDEVSEIAGHVAFYPDTAQISS